MNQLLTAWTDFGLSVIGWRSYYSMTSMGAPLLVYEHPIYGRIIFTIEES